jgi:cytochrome c-type biogenesis protein CcmF
MRAWARWTRPWTNVAWASSPLGIALGSWWAYYELGWGGWWFWDPVENASFMPWLAGTALLHSQAVTEKRGASAGWTLLLAIAAFSLSLLGTFLVRSGVLTSVHAFATDPARPVHPGLPRHGHRRLAAAVRAARAGQADAAAPSFAAGVARDPAAAQQRAADRACAWCCSARCIRCSRCAGPRQDLGRPALLRLLFLLLMAPLVALLPFGPLTRWQRESRPLRCCCRGRCWRWCWAWLAFFLAPQGRWKTAAGIAGAAWVAAGTLRFLWSALRTMPGTR